MNNCNSFELINIAWYLAYCCGWLVFLKWVKTIYVMIFGSKRFTQ